MKSLANVKILPANILGFLMELAQSLANYDLEKDNNVVINSKVSWFELAVFLQVFLSIVASCFIPLVVLLTINIVIVTIACCYRIKQTEPEKPVKLGVQNTATNNQVINFAHPPPTQPHHTPARAIPVGLNHL